MHFYKAHIFFTIYLKKKNVYDVFSVPETCPECISFGCSSYSIIDVTAEWKTAKVN